MTGKKIIIINGSAGSGKDTFVELCSKYIDGGIENYSYVSRVKRAARELGWDGNKDEESRKFLADLTDLSYEYNQYPLKDVLSAIQSFLSYSNKKVMFVHVREPKRIGEIKQYFNNVITLLIRNSNIPLVESNRADKSVSNRYEYDHTVHNDTSLEGLEKIAKLFVDSLPLLQTK